MCSECPKPKGSVQNRVGKRDTLSKAGLHSPLPVAGWQVATCTGHHQAHAAVHPTGDRRVRKTWEMARQKETKQVGKQASTQKSGAAGQGRLAVDVGQGWGKGTHTRAASLASAGDEMLKKAGQGVLQLRSRLSGATSMHAAASRWVGREGGKESRGARAGQLRCRP